jgi:probable F420-dependent oxidoreductase
MELGFGLPHAGPTATRENIRQVAIEAERMGYHSLWCNERLVKPVNPMTPYPGNAEGELDWQYETVYEHLTTLTYASALTERVRLGVSVLNLPFHKPVQLAKRIATMDQLSDGRIDLGIGLGWSEDEAHVTNTPFKARGRMGEEFIHALKALWGEDPVEFHGEFVDVPPAVFGPKPVQKPHPPLYMGAFAPVALSRAGRLADGFTGCCASVDAILAMRKQVRDAATAAGRDGDNLPTVVRCLVHRTDEPIDDPDRPVSHGTWEQIHEDVVRLDEAGVEVTFFDVCYQDDNDSTEALLGYMERFRGILDAAPATV